MKGTRKIVVLALLISQAMILSIIESWIPVPIGIYGIKLGLANIVTVILIMFFELKEALAVVVIRCLLSSMFGGGPIIFLFSVTGGALSTLVMNFLYRKLSKFFSIIGISVAGAVTHNVGQILVAVITMETLSVLSYLPILMVSGIIMGCFVGYCSMFLARALKNLNILS